MVQAGWRLGAFVVLALGVPGVARAATINVTTTQDVIAKDGACSLREAVISANTDSAAASGGDCVAGSGADTIVLPAGTYRLTLKGNEDSSFSPLDNDATVNDLDITSSATIQGAGAASTIIDANAIDRAFDTYASVELEGLTITGGRAQNTGVNRSDDGGGVRAAANLVVTDCAFVDNRAAAGRPGADATSSTTGGIALAGTGSPGGDGGAIYAEAGLTVSGTTFKNNVAGDGGASGNAKGGDNAGSNTSTAVDGGGAGAFAAGDGGAGGAIWAGTGASITGSTFVANTAGAGGTGGSAAGGRGGLFLGLTSTPPPKAGAGGGAVSGSGGAGGAGGAVYIADGAGTIAQSVFTANHSGAGGNAGKATGGAGLGIGLLSGAGGVGTGGKGGDGGDGGAIATAAGTGTLKLTDSTLSGNASGAGGAGGTGVGGSTGINTPGENGSIAAGVAQGGAGGASGNGGGIAVKGGATLVNVTLSGNATGAGGAGGLATPGIGTPATATGGAGGLGGDGGGIADTAAGSQVEIQNATLSSNTYGAPGAHGAPVNGGGGTVGTGSALALSGGTISVAGSIFSGNEAPGCFSETTPGAISDGTGNVRFPAADSSCPGTAGDPQLASLVDNGGPVPTQAIAAGSAAIGAAPAAGCPPADARGIPRPTGKPCDAGAYELAPPTTTTTTTGAPTSTTPGASGKTSSKLTTVGLSPKTFAATAKPTARNIGTSQTSSGIPLGTRFHLKLSENASVRFTFARKTTTQKGKRKVIHYVSAGAIAHSFKSGSETLPFSGWIGGKPLPPGRYRVSIGATDAAKHRSKTTTLSFTIVGAGASSR